MPKSDAKCKRKVRATDITVDELLAYDFRERVRLANKVSGTYAESLTEYLKYHEFLVTVRCTYKDEAILKFDDDFRRTADHEKISLSDER